jgi:hypothetical protein
MVCQVAVMSTKNSGDEVRSRGGGERVEEGSRENHER